MNGIRVQFSVNKIAKKGGFLTQGIVLYCGYANHDNTMKQRETTVEDQDKPLRVSFEILPGKPVESTFNGAS